MKNKLFILLNVVFLLLSEILLAERMYSTHCESLIQGRHSQKQVDKGFDWSLFQQVKEGLPASSLNKTSIEVVLAQAEQKLNRSLSRPISLISLVKTDVSQLSPSLVKKRGEILKLMSDLKKSREGWSEKQIQGFTSLLYLWNLGDTSILTSWQKSYSVRAKVKERVDQLLIEGTLTEVLDNLGLKRDPRIWEKLVLTVRKNNNIIEGITWSAVNIPALIYLGVPLSLPEFNFLKNALPSEAVQRSKQKSSLVKIARLDQTLHWSRLILTSAIYSYLGYLLYENWPYVKSLISLASQDGEELMDIQRKGWNICELRRQHWGSWWESYLMFEPLPEPHCLAAASEVLNEYEIKKDLWMKKPSTCQEFLRQMMHSYNMIFKRLPDEKFWVALDGKPFPGQVNQVTECFPVNNFFNIPMDRG